MSGVRRIRRPLGSLLVVVLTVTGCGLGDDAPRAAERPTTTSSSTTSTSTTSTTIAPTTTVPPTTTTLAPAELAPLRPPAAADDPAALAQQIATAELTIRDPAADAMAVGGAGLSQQVAYRKLARRPEWVQPVLDAVPEGIRGSITKNVEARLEFEAMHTSRSSVLPAWQIIPPESLDALLATYQEAASAFGLFWPFLAAIHLVETGTGRIRGLSSAGAQGPMQFMPPTWAAYGAGGDVNNTQDAIFGAARYLTANGGATDMDNALWNYNHSDHYVRGVTRYAEAIAEHPLALRGFYNWGIWYITASGDAYLPIGYATPEPIPALDYLAARPPFGA